MRKGFTISYGGLSTTFTQQLSGVSNLWSWVTTDTRTHTRIDGAEADPTSVLYMIWEHVLQEPELVITSFQID